MKKIAALKYKLQNENGMALLLVIIFTGALMVLGAALLSYALNEMLIADYHARDIGLYYIVEGGAEKGAAVLKEDFYFEGLLSGSLGGGSYRISFSDEYRHRHETAVDEEGEEYYPGMDNIRFARSIGTLEGHSKTMTLALQIDDDHEVSIIRWYKAFPKHLDQGGE